MRILLFGKTGQLGWELQRTLPCLGEVTALDFPEVDFSHPESLRTVVRSAAPDVVINAVAYTNVDKAEIEPEKCIGCTICARICPTQAITGELKKPHEVNKEACIGCEQCVAKCPKQAIKLV